jgi:hypothetical protein
VKPKETPRTRVIRVAEGQARLRSGVVQLTDEQGRTRYKLECDHCEEIISLRRSPLESDLVLCPSCQRLHQFGRPETEAFKEKGRTLYRTPCDTCGKKSVSRFIPKPEEPFYCMACKPRQVGAPVAGIEASKGAAEPTTPRFAVPCSRCRRSLSLAFQPPPAELVLCPDCYQRGEARKKSQESGPRILYVLECSACRRTEIIDKVPKNPDRALCSRCDQTKQKEQGGTGPGAGSRGSRSKERRGRS